MKPYFLFCALYSKIRTWSVHALVSVLQFFLPSIVAFNAPVFFMDILIVFFIALFSFIVKVFDSTVLNCIFILNSDFFIWFLDSCSPFRNRFLFPFAVQINERSKGDLTFHFQPSSFIHNGNIGGFWFETETQIPCEIPSLVQFWTKFICISIFTKKSSA